jgi:predicted signal transduction protein with EAL and GGDEF domain
LNKHEVFTTVSIGIALSSKGSEQPEELLRNADIAMYHAKNLGRARYSVFDTAMHSQAVELLQLETDLRRAIERQEFHLYYQPIFSLSTGKISGFEALVRWQHPERGPYLPSRIYSINGRNRANCSPWSLDTLLCLPSNASVAAAIPNFRTNDY